MTARLSPKVRAFLDLEDDTDPGGSNAGVRRDGGDVAGALVYRRPQEMIVTLLCALHESWSDGRAPGAAVAGACVGKCGMMIIMTGHPPRERTRAP